MAALQRVASVCSDSNHSSRESPNGAPQFPAGLRVLVVDDDNTCLAIIERMLQRCHYHVTTSTEAKVALDLLREKKGCFDLVLSDVHMPDMDGYKLLEFVGLEMDLPVIMMSADGRTSAVMKGIKHGACDYLIKPIREEELKNIWQHVVRKKWHEIKEVENSESLDDDDRYKRGNDDVEYASSLNEGSGVTKSQKKRSHAKEEDDGEPESDDPTTSKKPRVVWSVELHEQFVNAVNHLGIDKAVPKRILELMNVPGLTRENVASHLQKFRLFLKKVSGGSQQTGTTSAYSGPLDSNSKLHSLGRYDIQALAASGQIPPQTLAAMQAELLGRPTNSSHMATMEQPGIFQGCLQGSKYVPLEHGVPFGQPLSKCQSNVSKHFPQNMVSIEDTGLGYGAWPSSTLGPIGPNAFLRAANAQKGNLPVDNFHQELNHSVNVQPSCLVASSSTSVNPNCDFSGSPIIGYSGTGSLLSENGLNRQVQSSTMPFGASARQLPGFGPNMFDVQGIYGVKSGEIIDQGQFGSLGIVGRPTSIPTRFAVDEYESAIPNFSHESNGTKVKQEPTMEFLDTAKVGIPVSQQFPPMMS